MSTHGPDPRPPASPPGPEGAPSPELTETGSMRAVGSSLGTGAKATARGLKGVASVTGRASRATFRQARKAAGAQGAERSGLNRLIELHACNAAGDSAFAIALAGTVFFAGATSGERGPVLLFLGLTMVPFAIVAPLIGPFLDRFSHGRRWAIGATFALRAFLCWVLAGTLGDGSPWFYVAALGVLVSSKAYGVAKAAAVPRLLPGEITLVKANGRVALAGVVGACVSGPLAGAAYWIGPEWACRYAFVVFTIGTIAAILLPNQVDASTGEESLGSGARRSGLPPKVAFALRANCGPRLLSGFLTMFMTFVMLTEPLDGWESKTRSTLLVGLVIGAAGLGNTIGIVVASLARKINPAVMVVVALVADIVALVLATVFYSLVPLVALGLTVGLMQYLAKVSLDSTIQSGVPVRAHASAFAKGDTTLQLAWVIGGFLGVILSYPAVNGVGLAFAALLLTAWAVFVVRSRPGQPAPRQPAT
ncbi:MFS transporter [Nocardioides nitrophenolicus]|uniref:MFS transporter n=1 Tax=Nocardioides nitrophenolicus TaxID=60489 RepID=UPI00195678FD|nr:MFS transporter [Nocardioides nitrophenolicus]MBM7518837.1 MFS family permease [Nocardioides nitrophenolicus]